MRKELIILSGFLGSGKTTVLRNLLKLCATRKVAVLLNDFGEIPVDGAILRQDGVDNGMVVEIGGGSVFCACLRESFVTSMIEMSKREEDLVIVEASGMSDPSSIDKMLSLSGLDKFFDHTLTICLFDPVKSLKLASVLEVIPRQLASATVAVITKCDLADAIEINKAKDYISSKQPDLPVILSYNGQIALDTLPKRACKAFAFSFNTPETRPDSFVITSKVSSAEELIAVLEAHEEVLRVKGMVNTDNGSWFISDTGRTIEKRTADMDVPLTVICMQGTSKKIINILQDKNIVLSAKE